MSRVVVLGGGPAGLYASLLLARRDIPVVLLEREQSPGGLTAGTEIAGVRVDFGSHRLHPSIEPGILEDLESVLGGELQLRRRNGRIRMDGTWISFPISPGEILTRLRPATIARLGGSALRAMVTPNRSHTFSEVVSTGLGQSMGELFYFPYARKIWGVGPESLSGEQARRRISADTPTKLLRKALSDGDTGREFFYPRRGFSQISESLASAAADEGVALRLGEEVKAISGSHPKFEVATDEGIYDARLVLSTIPITVLARFLNPPEHVRAAIEEMRYRAMVLVYFVVPVERWTSYDAHYFPERGVRFTRISEPKNYRDGPDPTDRTVLCAEIPCDVGDHTWAEGDQTLLSEVRKDILSVGLPDPGANGVVHRLHSAYPIYRLGADEALAAVASWLDEEAGVVSYGRQGLFAHDNTHHALVMARDAVGCISGDLDFDRRSWDEARDRFSLHVVED